MAKEIHEQIAGLRLEIDLDQFELEDWEILDGSKPGTKMNDMLNVLDRLVVGGARGRGWKGQQLFEIQKAIMDQVMASYNPVKNGKN